MDPDHEPSPDDAPPPALPEPADGEPAAAAQPEQPAQTTEPAATPQPEQRAEPEQPPQLKQETDEPAPAAQETPASGVAEQSPEPLSEGSTPVAESPLEATAGEAGDAPPASTKGRTAKGVRERLAKDRALQAANRQALLTGRLAKTLLVLVILAGLAYLGRRPLLRTLARSGQGELNRWALNVLVGLEDPDSFDLYVANMGTRSDHFTPLVYRLAGRAQAPNEAGVPPDDAGQVAEHRLVLITAIEAPEPEVQRGGLLAFGCLHGRAWTRDPKLLQAVADALSSQDAISRRFAAIALRKVAPTPSHQTRLLNTVRSDTDRLTRRFAVQALALSGDPELGRELAKLRDDAPEVQRELFLAIARLGIPVSLKRLRSLYGEFPSLRQTVVESLAERSEAGVDELIETAIRDPSPGTRLAAAKSLRTRGRAEGLDALCYALGDADPSVRLQSMDSILARPDGPRAVPVLVGALEDHQGWEELRRLHATLKALTKHQGVPDPLQSQELTWTRTVGAWRSYLNAQRKR